MQTYVLLALSGFLLVLIAAIGIGTLLRRARPITTVTTSRPVLLSEPALNADPPEVLPFDNSALADETQPARPIALAAFSPLPEVANPRVDVTYAYADDGDEPVDADQVTLLIEPDNELTPQQRNVRRLIAYFKEKSAAAETAPAG